MGECSIDHSPEEVIKKLESQQAYLPEHVSKDLIAFLMRMHSQQTLNELFHLLKKYDLASTEEREERNRQIIQLIS